MQSISTSIQNCNNANCQHCSLSIPQHRKGSNFCCAGCQAVYQVLASNNVLEFYKLREKEDVSGVRAEVAVDDNFEYFDDENFIARNLKNAGQFKRIDFLLTGIHCSACIWLIEKLSQICPGVIRAELDFSKSIVKVYFDQKRIKISFIAQNLNALGYHPSEPTLSNKAELEKKTFKENLLKLGVAGIAAGNCMMIATSLYQAEFSGMEERFRYFLQLMSMVIATPAIFYSALPFYRATISGFRVATFHIDLPISLGLILGYAISSVNAIFSLGPTYFDSLTVLIFFMLSARFLQSQAIAKAVGVAERAKSMINFAYIQSKDGIKKIYPYSLKVGDLVVVSAGIRIPVDGKIIQGRTTIDLSIITGEAEPQVALENSLVLAGTKNLDNQIVIEATSSYVNSRFFQLTELQRTVAEVKVNSNKLSDLVSGYFVPLVLITTIVNSLYWYFNTGIEKAGETTLALLVITCPCAIGLAAPLTIVNALSKAFKKGIFVKEPSAFQEYLSTTAVVFDKTGTLTTGDYELRGIYLNKGEHLLDSEKINIASLAQLSRHLLSKCILKSLNITNPLDKTVVTDFNDHLGFGISGKINNDLYYLGSLEYLKLQQIQVSSNLLLKIDEVTKQGYSIALCAKDKEAMVLFVFGDKMRQGIEHYLTKLRNAGKKIYLLSGDNVETVRYVAQQLNFEDGSWQSSCSPEQKRDFIKQLKRTEKVLMVGDGVNDAEALMESDLSIALTGGIAECLRVADIFVSERPVENLQDFEIISTQVSLLIKIIISISVIYNILGALISVTGNASPLIAAVLMPLSSLTVIAIASFARVK